MRVDTFRRMTEDVAYDKACLEAIKTGYREFVCDGASSSAPITRASDPLPRNIHPDAPRIVPRRARITPKDLLKYECTVGCPGCEAIQLGLDQKRNHSEACRARIEAAMAEDEGDKERLARAKDRLDFRQF